MSDTSTTSQKVAAEFFGTFILVLFGCGAVVMATLLGGRVGEPAVGLVFSYLAIAIAFGFALVVGIYAFGRISGAHFNPAVSVGAALSGRMSWRQVPVYAGAQVAGAIVAAAVLLLVEQGLPDDALPQHTLGQNLFGDGGITWWGALIVEVLLTAVFVTVILAVTDARNESPASAPLTIGLALVVVHLFAIPLTGTSVNPARSIGPALFSGTDALKDLWLFIVAPLIGAAAAGLGYPAVFGRGSEPVPGSGLALGRPAAGSPVTVTGYAAPDQFQQEWNQQEPVAAYEPEPIIQDGWQWDHAAQEWKPLEQWTSPEPAVDPSAHPAPDASGAGALDAGTAETQRTADPAAGEPGWTGDNEQTQIRPRES